MVGTRELGYTIYRLVPLLLKFSLTDDDLQRNWGVCRRLETRMQENWTRYMEHKMTTTAFLRACDSLYGVRPLTPVADADAKDCHFGVSSGQ